MRKNDKIFLPFLLLMLVVPFIGPFIGPWWISLICWMFPVVVIFSIVFIDLYREE